MVAGANFIEGSFIGIIFYMQKEIERKFLVKKLPDLNDIRPFRYERYYLERGKGVEVRIQFVNGKYEWEKKFEKSALERSTEKKEISKSQFNALKRKATGAIIRDSYQLSQKPKTSIKIYSGRFEGLVRAEVEFDSIEEAKEFQPPEWMGKEITQSPLGRDAKLLDLTQEEFEKLLK